MKKAPQRLISWNVNGIRAALEKGFADFVVGAQPDLLCLQEVKALPEQVTDQSWAEGYHAFWNPAEKKGYSGTATFSRVEPLAVTYGMNMPGHDREGRVLTLEFKHHHVVNVYTPNSQNKLRRLPYRQEWDADFRAFVHGLEKSKPVIICGDLNVAHQEIDLTNPTTNRKNAGFTEEEREALTTLLEAGYLDSFREFHPDPKQYSWWSYRSNCRERNIGWRIDYWLVSKAWKKKLVDSVILNEIMGSDHCPVMLLLK
ncbi:MAG: exodeoxyribonuclease III [Verrucomicrobiota bacterium]